MAHTRREFPKPKTRLEAGASGFDIIEKHSMPDPSMSDAERLHRAGKRAANTVVVDVNMTTRLGGMARIRTREEAHAEAAARFNMVFDRVGNVGPKAIDPSAIRVDGGSAGGADALLVQAEAAGKHFGALRDALSPRQWAISVAIIANDESIAKAARSVFGADNGGRRRQVTEGLKSALDRIAAHFGLMALPQEGRHMSKAA
ncbi:MAG: hypothetical protein IR164_14140 [Devosia sp.]|uniref:hypothetical protein n=1 Tax=Devosia sp. TaxID=1871048 RepID=UPI001A099672|nr:hypothetical protein [Devosia sp.]MBF0680070.1 hypothetical protein [Devosia sp.]